MGGGVAFSASPATANIPTGSITFSNALGEGEIKDFTVPAGIKILKIESSSATYDKTSYVGVTPNTLHRLNYMMQAEGGGIHRIIFYLNCTTHNNESLFSIITSADEDNVRLNISWSPEINNHAPDKSHY